MAANKIYRFLLLCLLLFLVSSCAYPISKQLREEANKNLLFPMVLENPTEYVGSIVIWGGVIIQTINRQDGTEIIVLETPLAGSERPKDAEYSQGRFIAKSSRYLDAEIYKKGKKITVAGKIIGKKRQSVGAIKYTYPVIKIEELYLWKKSIVFYGSPYYGDWYWNYYPDEWGFGGDFDEDEFYEGDFDEGR